MICPSVWKPLPPRSLKLIGLSWGEEVVMDISLGSLLGGRDTAVEEEPSSTPVSSNGSQANPGLPGSQGDVHQKIFVFT